MRRREKINLGLDHDIQRGSSRLRSYYCGAQRSCKMQERVLFRHVGQIRKILRSQSQSLDHARRASLEVFEILDISRTDLCLCEDGP